MDVPAFIVALVVAAVAEMGAAGPLCDLINLAGRRSLKASRVPSPYASSPFRGAGHMRAT
jgi:hypothetical protein